MPQKNWFLRGFRVFLIRFRVEAFPYHQLEDDDSDAINRAMAKALQISVKEVASLPDNVMVWISYYQFDPAMIGAWIKFRLLSYDKPRAGSILEYLKTSDMEWNLS